MLMREALIAGTSELITPIAAAVTTQAKATGVSKACTVR
jgi:hypothetical protein